ncbi:MAG: hypothetical protein PHZ26_00010, partial [Candidatus Gracilibacteria bacterium]|nr:hypothetical protein [Candidatus Gracilibacteria bacterium]
MSKKNNLDDFGLFNSNTDNSEINTSWEMPKYFMNIIIFLSVSLYVISLYYASGSHAESTSYRMYFLTIIGIYLAYKFIKTSSSKEKVVFSPAGIIGYTFINILILCIFFFSLSGGQNGALVLFFKIIGFLILPFSIGLINYSFAKKILSYIPSYKNEETPFKFILALGFGFVVFFTLITISATLGQYNLTAVFAILLILAGVAFKELYQSLISLATYKIEFDNHKLNSSAGDLVNFNLLSAEWSFLILSFLIGVNFINIVRPMPIGWDDLGVYMNFPQIMANSGTILKGAGLVAWQLLTGIGFMFHSAPQAFFMNQIGGILSIIVLTVVFSDLLKSSTKKHLSVPIILATMFYVMPMVIFEQAKDMKVDPGLFFVSVIGIYLIYKLFLRYLGYEETKITSNTDSIITQTKDGINLFFSKISSVFKSNTGEGNLFDNRDYLIYIAIIGAIVGLAFAIKVSSVMLILGIIGVIFYAKLGFSGFLGYFALFIGVFTKLKLWDMMN